MRNAVEKALSAPLVSHFTPSLMAYTTLETITVERHDLVAELVGEIIESASNPTKAQTLLVGPRGIGKTHLVALAYHRVRAAKLDNLCIAWLREEEYGVVSWLDLLLRIFRALEEESPRSTPRAQLNLLYDLPTEVAEQRAQTLLQEYLNGRTLLLLVENLDAIFADIKEAGQRKWRAWMQEHLVTTTLATSPALFNGISGRNAPFYGFFRIETLHALDVDGAALLLQKIARARGDEELAEFIETPVGHARVRAVHHLAGGNFRIYVVFASFLKKESLDELVGPFLQLLDELTPYYQGHLATLSAQQRKIIEVLCDYRGAMPVKLLASRGFMTQQTASSQLVILRERGYVVSLSRGRESFYELREPLLRLCLEVKKQRGEPVALLIDFLRIWYRHEELSHRLESCAPEANWEREYLVRALAEKEKETEDPVLAACERDFDLAVGNKEWEKALRICDELDELRCDGIDKSRRAACLFNLGLHDAALAMSEAAMLMQPENFLVWGFHILLLHEMNRYEDFDVALEKLMIWACEQESELILGWAWKQKGIALDKSDQHYKSLIAFNKSLKFISDDEEVLLRKATAQRLLGHLGATLKTLKKLENQGYESPRMKFLMADVLLRMGKSSQAFPRFVELSELMPEDAFIHIGLADSALSLKEFSVALRAAERALEIGDLDESFFCAKIYQAQASFGIGWSQESFEILDDAVFAFIEDHPHLLNHLLPMIGTFYAAFDNQKEKEEWKKLLSIFCRQSVLPVFADALSRYTRRLIANTNWEHGLNTTTRSTNELRPQARKALEWSRLWLELSQDSPQGDRATLHFAARLSAVAIGVAASGDDRPLLDLPSEERAIALEMLEGRFDSEATQNSDDEDEGANYK